MESGKILIELKNLLNEPCELSTPISYSYTEFNDIPGFSNLYLKYRMHNLAQSQIVVENSDHQYENLSTPKLTPFAVFSIPQKYLNFYNSHTVYLFDGSCIVREIDQNITVVLPDGTLVQKNGFVFNASMPSRQQYDKINSIHRELLNMHPICNSKNQ